MTPLSFMQLSYYKHKLFYPNNCLTSIQWIQSRFKINLQALLNKVKHQKKYPVTVTEKKYKIDLSLNCNSLTC